MTGAPGPVVVAAPPAPAPLRIKTLTLRDFRAFPGPEKVAVTLNGKNLLVYGENGAGKSSLFHALDNVFSVAKPNSLARKEQLLGFQNIFSGQPDTDVMVEVEFVSDAKPASWTTARHPVDSGLVKADPRILNGGLRKAMLDYRALLDTNYGHKGPRVNLFDVCVQVLLRDYEAIHNGKPIGLLNLWRQMEPLPQAPRLYQPIKDRIEAYRLSFNAALSEALELIVPKANEILAALGWGDVQLENLSATGVRFPAARLRKDRRYVGKEVTPSLKFRGQTLASPQTFLNEARLSALALAIYFAGREICAATLQADTPRLMVLDDVLIGLDQSNRYPVLEVLRERFIKTDWQIILLTHDRVWFEMARLYLEDTKDWAFLEIFEGVEPSGGGRPILRTQQGSDVASNIATARKFLADKEYSAATVHARMAFELSLKKLCDRKHIPVNYYLEPRRLSTDDLLQGIEKWLGDAARATEKPLVLPAITQVKLWRKVVLNPFSHSTPITLVENEVKGAIDAVETLQAAFVTHIPK